MRSLSINVVLRASPHELMCHYYRIFTKEVGLGGEKTKRDGEAPTYLFLLM